MHFNQSHKPCFRIQNNNFKVICIVSCLHIQTPVKKLKSASHAKIINSRYLE